MEFNTRVWSCSPESNDDRRHVLHWEDIYFYPNLQNCSAIFLHIDSTKSRHVKELKPTWTAVGRVTSIPIVCPVRWMIRHFCLNYSGKPSDPVFCLPGTSTPLTRQRYTERLRDRLAQSASEFLPGFRFNPDSYSGISWRNGCVGT